MPPRTGIILERYHPREFTVRGSPGVRSTIKIDLPVASRDIRALRVVNPPKALSSIEIIVGETYVCVHVVNGVDLLERVRALFSDSDVRPQILLRYAGIEFYDAEGTIDDAPGTVVPVRVADVVVPMIIVGFDRDVLDRDVLDRDV